jgi:superfamily II DNA/RNA helicase
LSSFNDLGVSARLADVLTGAGISTPTSIQAAALPDALAGRDVLGRGRTGSGKTLAFLLPVVQRLANSGRPAPRSPRALILAPTRELVAQIDAVLQPLAAAAGLTTRTVFGGVGQNPQVTALRRGVDIVLACPGRLEDLINQGHCSLAKVEITVLDEADHMADLGFLPAVRRLLGQTPRNGQRMLFSATLDAAVDTIVRTYLSKPAVHGADSEEPAAGVMSHHVLQIDRDLRLPVLLDLTSAPGRTVVFTRTKHGAKALARQLNSGGVPAVELHGNLSQNARTRAMDDFHTGRVLTLVATDIAARGIHVDDIALVIHADPPADHKAYLHRSGRTARAGNSGIVVTLMTGEQTREVRGLARAAGVRATTTRISSVADPVLATLAPGARVLTQGRPAPAARGTGAGSSGGRGARSGRGTGSSTGRGGRSGSVRHEKQGSESRTRSPQQQGARRRSSNRRGGNAPARGHSPAAFSSGRR